MNGYDRVRMEMFDDPECSGDVLLLGLAMAHHAEHLAMFKERGKQADRFRRVGWVEQIDQSIGREGITRSVLNKDAPHYEIDWKPAVMCVGTMLRPQGAPCSKKASTVGTIPHPITGERERMGACSKALHQGDFEDRRKKAWQAWRDNGEPQPKPNTGGVLARYFTGIETYYAWARPDYDRSGRQEETPLPLAPVISLAGRKK